MCYEVKSVYVEEAALEAELKAAEAAINGADAIEPDDPAFNDALERYNDRLSACEAKGVFKLDPKVDRIIKEMEFSEGEAAAPVSSFSGGWKMRIGLAKMLLQEPDVLLLDEPTNHMDIASVEWLEAFLRAQSMPMVIVSHDREFLDQV